MRRLHDVAATQLADVYGSCGVYDTATCQLVVFDQRRQVLAFTPMDARVGTEAAAGPAGDGAIPSAHSSQVLQGHSAMEEVHIPEAEPQRRHGQGQQEEAGGGAGAGPGAGPGAAQGQQEGPAGDGGGPAPGAGAGQVEEQQDQKTQYDLQVRCANKRRASALMRHSSMPFMRACRACRALAHTACYRHL